MCLHTKVYFAYILLYASVNFITSYISKGLGRICKMYILQLSKRLT